MTPGIDQITLRDFFAVFAIQALISEPNLKATKIEFAQRAYVIADAMLKERAKND